MTMNDCLSEIEEKVRAWKRGRLVSFHSREVERVARVIRELALVIREEDLLECGWEDILSPDAKEVLKCSDG